MEVVFTVDDPNMFTSEWSGRILYNRSNVLGLDEEICAENNRLPMGSMKFRPRRNRFFDAGGTREFINDRLTLFPNMWVRSEGLSSIVKTARWTGTVDSMSMSAVSASIPPYQAPQTKQAKTDDERTESMTVKTKEAQTGKDAPVQVRTKIIAVNALDIKA
jgi:hypothetical protein